MEVGNSLLVQEAIKGCQKPQVMYVDGTASTIKVGNSVMLFPINHTSPYVSNEKYAHTSEVVVNYGNGVFETQNSLYVPESVAQCQQKT
jgi:hypothetical protein